MTTYDIYTRPVSPRVRPARLSTPAAPTWWSSIRTARVWVTLRNVAEYLAEPYPPGRRAGSYDPRDDLRFIR